MTGRRRGREGDGGGTERVRPRAASAQNPRREGPLPRNGRRRPRALALVRARGGLLDRSQLPTAATDLSFSLDAEGARGDTPLAPALPLPPGRTSAPGPSLHINEGRGGGGAAGARRPRARACRDAPRGGGAIVRWR